MFVAQIRCIPLKLKLPAMLFREPASIFRDIIRSDINIRKSIIVGQTLHTKISRRVFATTPLPGIYQQTKITLGKLELVVPTLGNALGVRWLVNHSEERTLRMRYE